MPTYGLLYSIEPLCHNITALAWRYYSLSWLAPCCPGKKKKIRIFLNIAYVLVVNVFLFFKLLFKIVWRIIWDIVYMRIDPKDHVTRFRISE